MSELVVRGPCEVLSDEISVPGDKSISHRALMIGAIAQGRTTISHFAPGDDVAATRRCLAAYGVDVQHKDGCLVVDGRGLRSFAEPDSELDCANSGTTMRLLAGLAAHHAFTSIFDGDDSLRRRPMQRLVGPLQALGARVDTTDGRPPVRVSGGALRGAVVDTGIPSAQVKSSVLLAALGADGPTAVTEPRASRDHTERLLAALGVSITQHSNTEGAHTVEIDPFAPPAFELVVPGDPSSAAFLAAAAALCGRTRIADVGLNPGRLGLFRILEAMGADVAIEYEDERLGEPVGMIEVRRSNLAAVDIDGSDPAVQDELPVLAVVATQAEGVTRVHGAGELRLKESDRIATIVTGLNTLGADAEEIDDGFIVRGPTPLLGAAVSPAGDHRMAMALAVAGLAAKGETTIRGFDAAAVSWPGFDEVLKSLGAEVELR